MNEIDTDIIRNIISFLAENEEYGDDWHEEIAELDKIIDIVDGKQGLAMKKIKFSVVCVGCEDSYVYSVDLFNDYEAAREFMRKDAKEMNEECMNSLMLNDYGDEIVASDGDGDAYIRVIKPVDIY